MDGQAFMTQAPEKRSDKIARIEAQRVSLKNSLCSLLCAEWLPAVGAAFLLPAW